MSWLIKNNEWLTPIICFRLFKEEKSEINTPEKKY